ncbi:MAG: glycosyltransferase [Candidatus Woesearchaeota archaeon]
MRISIFTNNYKPFTGGVERSIENQRSILQKKGHDPYIFAPRYPRYKDKEKNIIRLPSVNAPTYPGYYLPLAFRNTIRRHMRDINPHIVHTHHPFLAGEAGLRIARKMKLPIIFTYHTLYEKYLHYIPLDRNITRPMVNELVQSYANQCDVVIAPSQYVKDSIKLDTRVEVIPTGIEINNHDKKDYIREKYHLPKSTKILFHAGRLTKEKNLYFLIRSIIKILKEKRDVICFIAGKGSEKEGLMNLAEKNNLSHRIIFTGNLEKKELARYYAGADLFLFASKSETQGLVLMEAMAGSTPVIAIDGPAIDECVIHNKNGLIAKENTEDFKNKTLEALKHLPRFSRNARKFAERYSIDNMGKRLLDIYKEYKGKEVNTEYKDFRQIKNISKIEWSQIITTLFRREQDA